MTDKPWQDKDTLERLYHEKKMSQIEIADHLGCHKTTLQKWFYHHGIESRSRGEASKFKSMKDPHMTVYTDVHGYEFVYPCYDGEQNRVNIHRLIAVAKYGFDAVANKDVHHKNDIPWDNRPSNIAVLDKTAHSLLQSDKYDSIDSLPQDYPWKDKGVLEELYHQDGLTTDEMGEYLGCSGKTIRNWMEKHGLERRPSPV